MDVPSTLRLRLHPRVAQQNVDEQKVKDLIAQACARITPFPGRTPTTLLAVLDWDHRLPSKTWTLRLHLCESDESVRRVESQLGEIAALIGRRNRFPEFDVPDFAGVEGDESYDVDLKEDFSFEAMRLSSRWRRQLREDDRALACKLVLASPEFAEKQRAVPNREDALGELEAVAWSSPSESGLDRWVLDVWWLTAFDGMVGRGFSFLVDLSPLAVRSIVLVREFAVRAG